MADTLTTLYRVPVQFVDGQQPTAQFMNAFAKLIEEGFNQSGDIIGDFNGESSNVEPYITSFVRAIGNMGYINPRLPRGAEGQVIEKLADYEGRTEFDLTFDRGQVSSFPGWTRVANREALVGNKKYMQAGRRITTSTPIEANDTIRYLISTVETDYDDAGAPGSGFNCVPSVPQIALGSLCVISKPAGYALNKFKITHPSITHIYSDIRPFSVGVNDVIKLTDATSLVRADLGKYPVPLHLMSGVANGQQLQENAVQLWYKSGASVERVTSTTGRIIFAKCANGSANELDLYVPEDLVGALPHQGVGGNSGNYILVYGGSSIAEGLLHLKALFARHDHSGDTVGKPVSANSLSERFDTTKWRTGIDANNPFPQYLDRLGITEGQDNGNNIMLGDIGMGVKDGTIDSPTNGVDETYQVRFGTAAAIFATSTDDDDGGIGGKLELRGRAVRIKSGNLFLGAADHSISLKRTNDTTLVVGTTSGSSQDEVSLSSGAFLSRSGLMEFASEGSIQYTIDEDTSTFEFSGGDTSYIKADGYLIKDKPVDIFTGAESLQPYVIFEQDYDISGVTATYAFLEKTTDLRPLPKSFDTTSIVPNVLLRPPLMDPSSDIVVKNELPFWKLTDGARDPFSVLGVMVNALYLSHKVDNKYSWASVDHLPLVRGFSVTIANGEDGQIDVPITCKAIYSKTSKHNTGKRTIIKDWTLERTPAELGIEIGDQYKGFDLDFNFVTPQEVEQDGHYFFELIWNFRKLNLIGVTTKYTIKAIG